MPSRLASIDTHAASNGPRIRPIAETMQTWRELPRPMRTASPIKRIWVLRVVVT